MDTSAVAKRQTEKRSFVAWSPYIGLALLMIGMTVVGFWPSYFGPLVTGTLDTHWVIDVHAAVFSAWLVLFLVQSVLAGRGQIRRHQTLGTYVGIAWGVLLLGVGCLVTFAVIPPGVGGANQEPDAFSLQLILGLGDVATFALLFGAGILYRRRPEIHKRLMVLAAVALMGAPVGRFPFTGGTGMSFVYYVGLRLLPAFIAMGYDLWTRRRIHPAYLVGTGVLVLNVSRLWLLGTEVWRAVTVWVMDHVRPIVEAVL